MAKSYLITGPLHVANKKPGDTVTGDELTDADFLVSIGYIEPIRQTRTKKSEDDGAGLVESTSESDVDSLTDTKQETR